MGFRGFTFSVLFLSISRNLASMLGVVVVVCALLGAGSIPAQALSLVEQAHVNVLEKLRPDIAGKISKKLDEIEKSNLTERQKFNARKKLFAKQLQKAVTAAKAADKFGDKNQKKAAQEVVNVVSSLGGLVLQYPKALYPRPKSVKKEIKRLKKEAKKKSEAEKKKSASLLGGSDVSFSFTGEVGKSYRKSSYFLRSELGVVIDPKLLSFNNDDTSGGNTAELKGSFAPGKVSFFGPKTYWKAGWNWYGTEAKASINNFALNNNNLGIISPEANGGLGGGVLINAGGVNFSDITDVHYKNHFYETNLFGEIGSDIPHGAGTLRPSFRIALGHTDLDEKLSGTTAAGGLDFDYKNSLMAYQGTISGGLELLYPLGDIGGVPIEYYGSIAAGMRFYQFDGKSRLTTNGLLNARERVKFDDFKVSYTTQVYLGLAAEVTPNLEFTTGVRFRQTEAPRVEINGNEDAHIKLESAQELTFSLGLKMVF